MARRGERRENPSKGLFDEPSGPNAPLRFTVGELSAEVQARLLELGRIGVEGELASLKRHSSGHLYFDLKDDRAKLSCVVWQSQIGRAVRFSPEDGMRVVASGRLDVYAPRGEYKLVVDRLEPLGLGALLLELERLKAELGRRGWFDRARSLPVMPGVIGLVTSRDGAALGDFLRTRTLRWPLYPVRFAHAAVQGPFAAREIAQAIARLDASGVDVIVIVRGGGSIEDLWAFNERAVAEAIWNASVPVVTGIGHEMDTTLADLVADRRAHTPTDAAQTVIPSRSELDARLARFGNLLVEALDGLLASRLQRLHSLARRPGIARTDLLLGSRAAELRAGALRLERGFDGILRGRLERLRALDRRLERQAPRARLERVVARLIAAGRRLVESGARRLEHAQGRFELGARTLETMSPLAVLSRGYSLTRRSGESAPVCTADEVSVGEEIETCLGRGTLQSRVSHVSRVAGVAHACDVRAESEDARS